jgi:hypothetical protein
VLAYAVYIPICVVNPRLMLSSAEGIGFLLVVAWALPALVVGARQRLARAHSDEAPKAGNGQ